MYLIVMDMAYFFAFELWMKPKGFFSLAAKYDVRLKKVPELTDKEYYAWGMTALLDAVGRIINSTFGKMKEAVIK